MPVELPILLIVDGDSAMRATLREQLTRDGAFAVTEAASARDADGAVRADGARFGAAIVDTTLPDGDGHALCAQWRADGLAMPIILLNGSNKAHGAGATISIAKPFRLSDLMTRLRALLDAARAAPPEACIAIGPFDFRPAEKALRERVGERRIRLTEKESAILAFLHGTGRLPVSRQVLLREVWGYNPSVTTHTLETHIYRLRRKLEADPSNACLLVTEAGGYRLAAG